MDDKKNPPKTAQSTAGQPTATDKTTSTAAPATTPTTTSGTGGNTNGLAIGAIICAFLFPLIGLILGIVALAQIKKSGEKGRGLAVASIVISIVIMVGIFLAIGTAFYAVNQAAKKAGLNYDASSGSVSVKNDEGESLTVGNAKLPDGFPSDVPIYKPSDVISSLKTKEGYNVTLATADSSQKVSDFYKNELKGKGWASEESEVNFGTLSGQTYTKGDQQLVVIITTEQNARSDKKTAVNLTVAKKTNSD